MLRHDRRKRHRRIDPREVQARDSGSLDGQRRRGGKLEAHTGHSDAILTGSREVGDEFTDAVDSAAVYVNASTRFTDGGEFGFGAEIGISTQKLHARGPIGVRELTTYKYVVEGSGQVRE